MRFSTALLTLSAPLFAAAAPVKWTRDRHDANVVVIKFAHLLEVAETDFYRQALEKFVEQDFIDAGITVPAVAIQTFQGILEHEQAHTDFLARALADLDEEPIQGCQLDFSSVLTDVATMAAVARTLEAVGVSAYLGAAQLITDPNVLAAAGAIAPIEAQHSALLNTLNGATGVPQAFEVALSPEQVLPLVAPFVSGCDPARDLGLTANQPVTITNQGSVGPGTRLELDSPALADVQGDVSCQMLVGGQSTSISFPIDECIVPDGINGIVFIFLTSNSQPLAADVTVRAKGDILAGPTIAFIDTQPDTLGALLRSGSPPVDSSEDLTPDEAQDELDDAVSSDGGDDETSTAPRATNTPVPENASNGPATPPVIDRGVSFIPA